MKSSRTFNNLSDKLKALIPKLKPGQSVVFEMTNGVPNPEPDEKERSKQPMLYPKVQLMTKFRVFDPFAGEPFKNSKGEDEYPGQYIDVGVVDSWRGEEPIAFRCFIPGVNGAGAFMSFFPGKFELRGGNVADEELYEILYLSPQREGSPCPDAAVEVIFRIKDDQQEAKRANTRFDNLKKVIDLLGTIKADKAREVMAALNQPTFQDDDLMIASLKDWAKNNVDDFMKAYESPLTSIKAVVKGALDSGKLVFDITSGEIKLGAVLLTKMTLDNHNDFVPEFANWLHTATNGKEVLENIKSQVEKKKPAAA